MITDISLYESGSGGEFNLLSNDLETTGALWNNIYLALFGGNLRPENQSQEFNPDEINFSYWQNETFYSQEPEKQLTSLTESLLNKTVINSKGLNDLEEAVGIDLQYLQALGELDISVSQDGIDRIRIDIFIQESETQTELALKFIWDNTLKEVIVDIPVGNNPFVKPSEISLTQLDFVIESALA